MCQDLLSNTKFHNFECIGCVQCFGKCLSIHRRKDIINFHTLILDPFSNVMYHPLVVITYVRVWKFASLNNIFSYMFWRTCPKVWARSKFSSLKRLWLLLTHLATFNINIYGTILFDITSNAEIKLIFCTVVLIKFRNT